MEPHKDHIVLNKRQISMIMASVVIFCLFIFIVGFFLGKHAAIDDFSSNVTQNALHDQIDYLLTSQSLKSSQDEVVDDDIVKSKTKIIDTTMYDAPQKTNIANGSESIVMPIQEIKISHAKVVEEKNNDELITQANAYNPQYACLIGFGTKQAVNSFIARLKKHHISVILKTNISKTASGKVRTWYQAITPTYNTATELQGVIRKVKRLEHIRDNDMKIVYVKQ